MSCASFQVTKTVAGTWSSICNGVLNRMAYCHSSHIYPQPWQVHKQGLALLCATLRVCPNPAESKASKHSARKEYQVKSTSVLWRKPCQSHNHVVPASGKSLIYSPQRLSFLWLLCCRGKLPNLHIGCCSITVDCTWRKQKHGSELFHLSWNRSSMEAFLP